MKQCLSPFGMYGLLASANVDLSGEEPGELRSGK